MLKLNLLNEWNPPRFPRALIRLGFRAPRVVVRTLVADPAHPGDFKPRSRPIKFKPQKTVKINLARELAKKGRGKIGTKGFNTSLYYYAHGLPSAKVKEFTFQKLLEGFESARIPPLQLLALDPTLAGLVIRKLSREFIIGALIKAEKRSMDSKIELSRINDNNPELTKVVVSKIDILGLRIELMREKRIDVGPLKKMAELNNLLHDFILTSLMAKDRREIESEVWNRRFKGSK